MMEIEKMIRGMEKEFKVKFLIILVFDSLNIVYYYFVFRYIND